MSDAWTGCYRDPEWCLVQAERWAERADDARRRVAGGQEPSGWGLHACEYEAGWYLGRARRLAVGEAVEDVGVVIDR